MAHPQNIVEFSLDRLDDDSLIKILSYLTLEEKINAEFVSKRWQRCLYEEQFVLDLTDPLKSSNKEMVMKNSFTELYHTIHGKYQLDVLLLNLFLENCPKIKNVIINNVVHNSVLSLIGRYCPNIKSLVFQCNHKFDREFATTVGPKLSELTIGGVNGIKEFLKFCPNLKKVHLQMPFILFDDHKNFAELGRNTSIRYFYRKCCHPYVHIVG